MKSLRLKFLPGEQKAFLQNICLKSNLSTKQLALIAKIHPRSFIDWKREKLTMSYEAAKIFCDKFQVSLPESEDILIARWREVKNEASRKGGLALFMLHGSPATVEGRRLGGIKSISNLRKNGVIPSVKIYKTPSVNELLAEYIGIMLGDGGMTTSQCAITLNSEADKDYIFYVQDIAEKLFGEKPKMFKRKNDKAVTLYYNGSFLVRYFTKVGLKVGNKVKQQVDVPAWIKMVAPFKNACLRGLMDTDGGVFLHKYQVKNKSYTYKKICFSNRSVPLLVFVSNTLTELGLTPKIIDKVENKKVWLYNSAEVEKYLKIVGTHNPRLLKYQV